MGCSVAGQFVIHLATLIYVMKCAQSLVPDAVKSKPDADFAPSLLNTVVFLIMATMQLANFAINYEGPPFMEGLAANKPLRTLLIFAGSMILFATAQVVPDFNQNIQLVLLPPPFNVQFIGVMIGDVVLAWGWERLCKWLLY
jgi:cation-transporting ATPase 13A1